MRPKPPPKVALGPYTIPVKFDHDAMAAAGGNGAYLQDMSTIMLQDVNSLDVERDTLLHECLHAIWSQSWLDKKYDDDAPESEGELIITELAPRLLELLRRNPKLVTYLVGD